MFWGKSRNIIAALEVGSTKVAVAVGEIRPDGTLEEVTQIPGLPAAAGFNGIAAL